ncbi:hypothetical protein ENUP19_0305G0003 [Entamoeba nuttalli]|uniref:Uncharacterized protein n=1 Tax=Entamoeba nuttalli TaxID=412467 RepID=A0ABQ0DV95_9EUKA
MYGTPINVRKDKCSSDDETEIDKRSIIITDFIELLQGINDISNKCSLLTGRMGLTFGAMPLKCFNLVLTKHVEVIEEILDSIKIFKKKNRLILSELKEEERRIDEREKKKEEESKPERRKTREL